jgi:predicted transcriptional regulator of viral defense system
MAGRIPRPCPSRVTMRPGEDTVERKLARLGRNSHGVVTRVELLAAGVTPAQIRLRARKGALIRVHRGVFRIGHAAPSLEADYLAAVKSCGRGALLAGRAAGYLFGVLKGSAPAPEVITSRHPRTPGVVIRRGRVGRPEATKWRGIPVTTLPRTLVDLAAVLGEGELARACHEAGVRHRTTPAQVEQILARRDNWPGARRLRRVLLGEVPVSLSRLESSFIARVRQAGLAIPETNRAIDGRRVDCRWPSRRLTVELDSYRYHHSRHAWEQDREREREARARGDQFRRYTWADVSEHPEPMLADLRLLLDRGR